MPPAIEDDEFGGDEFDEEDLLALDSTQGTNREASVNDNLDDQDLLALGAAVQGTKRKAFFDDSRSPKRLQRTFPCAAIALTGRFGFKSFQLKQEQVNPFRTRGC